MIGFPTLWSNSTIMSQDAKKSQQKKSFLRPQFVLGFFSSYVIALILILWWPELVQLYSIHMSLKYHLLFSKHTVAYIVFDMMYSLFTGFSLMLAFFLIKPRNPAAYFIISFLVIWARCHETAGSWVFTVACFNTVTYVFSGWCSPAEHDLTTTFFSAHDRDSTKKLQTSQTCF